MGISSSQELCDAHFINICKELRCYGNRAMKKICKEIIYLYYISSQYRLNNLWYKMNRIMHLMKAGQRIVNNFPLREHSPYTACLWVQHSHSELP